MRPGQKKGRLTFPISFYQSWKLQQSWIRLFHRYGTVAHKDSLIFGRNKPLRSEWLNTPKETRDERSSAQSSYTRVCSQEFGKYPKHYPNLRDVIGELRDSDEAEMLWRRSGGLFWNLSFALFCKEWDGGESKKIPERDVWVVVTLPIN